MPLRDLETWMWTEACEIVNRADRLHRQFFRPAVSNTRQPTWEPPIDIYETCYEIKIIVALPGVVYEHLNVKLEGEYLLIAGQRHQSAGTEAYIRRLEIPYGRFERRIELPVGDLEVDSCELSNGCLLISLRKI